MKWIKGKNKYGFYSGGYIMDKMDREALKGLNKYYPSTRKEFWFTQHCSFDFKKQLCNTDEIKIIYKIDKSFTTAKIITQMFQNGTEIAKGYFTFVKAEHNYCKQGAEE